MSFDYELIDIKIRIKRLFIQNTEMQDIQKRQFKKLHSQYQPVIICSNLSISGHRMQWSLTVTIWQSLLLRALFFTLCNYLQQSVIICNNMSLSITIHPYL